MLVNMCIIFPPHAVKLMVGAAHVPGNRLSETVELWRGEFVIRLEQAGIMGRLRARGCVRSPCDPLCRGQQGLIDGIGLEVVSQHCPQPQARTRSAWAPMSKQTTKSRAAIAADSVYMNDSGQTDGTKATCGRTRARCLNRSSSR